MKKENKMQGVSERLFNAESYTFNGRFNSGYAGAILDLLKCSQHLYKREDVANAYRFLADIIEKGDFGWPGTFDLKPSTKNDNIETRGVEEPIASTTQDTTSKKVRKGTAKPRED